MSRIISKDEHRPELFSRRFRMLMAFWNLTLEQIAKRTGHAISTVGTWKNGRLPNSMSTIDKIAELFGVSAEYLLTGVARDYQQYPSIVQLQEVEGQVRSMPNMTPAGQYNPWTQPAYNMQQQPMYGAPHMMPHQPMMHPMMHQHQPMMHQPMMAPRMMPQQHMQAPQAVPAASTNPWPTMPDVIPQQS